MRTRGSKRAFTLIELLVVIAIIAILAAILFPVFIRAKDQAQLSTCINNQKQICLAILQYTDDYKGRYPWAGASNWPGGGNTVAHKPKPFGPGGSKTLPDAIEAYVKEKRVLWCPVFSKGLEAYGWSYWYFCEHDGQLSGVLNKDPQTGKGKASLCGHSQSEVEIPSGKPMICEIWSLHHLLGQSDYKWNIGYCDGHVRTEKVPTDYNMRCVMLYRGRDGSWPDPQNPAGTTFVDPFPIR